MNTKKHFLLVLALCILTLFVGCGRIKISVVDPNKDTSKTATNNETDLSNIDNAIEEEDNTANQEVTEKAPDAEPVSNEVTPDEPAPSSNDSSSSSDDSDDPYASKTPYKTPSPEVYNELSYDQDLVNAEESNPYKKGKYPEIDFMVSSLTNFINGDKSVYDSFISYNRDHNFEGDELISLTADDQTSFDKYLQKMAIDMDLTEGQKVKLDVTEISYQGTYTTTDTGIRFMVCADLIPEGSSDTFFDVYFISIFEKDGQLYMMVE
ncbi:MAG: hypothetical protein ACRCTE_04815 [Cellulosilyticaceae bacterium]